MITTKLNDDIQRVNSSILLLYPMVETRWSRVVSISSWTWTFQCRIFSPEQKLWRNEVKIDEEHIHHTADVTAFLFEVVHRVVEELINSIPVEEIGLYPFARIWNDTHQASSNRTLLWYPKKLVPGWVFSRAYESYPQDKGKDEATHSNQPELQKVENRIQNEELQRMRKAINMATTTKKTKKRVIQRAPIQGFNPDKVKAPECVNHKEPMIFDKVEQKWRCPVDGCKVVARPKRDEDDKTVILGKGGIQLRLVVEDDKRSVVLISDDNVALNVTPFVDIDEIIEKFDVIDQAKVASTNGRENFATPTEKSVGIKMRLVVMGATDLTE